MTRLLLGCGLKKKDGYVNVDLRETVNPDVCADMRDLDYPEASVEEIFFDDSFEHINYVDAEKMLVKCHSWLTPQGKIVIKGLPNMKEIANVYNSLGDADSHALTKMIYGMDGRGEGGYSENRHLWGYTPRSMALLMDKTKFRVTLITAMGDVQFTVEAVPI